MKIACFGDSLTFGSVGYSYIKYLDRKNILINKGVNGDTTTGAYKRLKKFIEYPANNDVDVYVIAIGTNDLLLPYLSDVSLSWRLQMAPRVKIKKCISDDALYETEYQKFIKLILSHNKNIIIVGLPLIQLKNYPNESVQKRNLIMKKLANDYHVSFIDTAFLQQQAIQNISLSHTWKHKNIIRIIDGMIMLALPFSKDWFSKFRRLELTVDGVHFNSRAAKLIGYALQEKILEISFKG
jgi:lysophospholipase L1-like esterase